MAGVNALPIIGSSYIKDERLMQMTSFAFSGSNADTVNVYVDLHSVLNKLVGPSYNMELRVSDYEIASGVINMIAHYRSFFWRKLKVYTRFYFVFSLNSPMSAKTYIPEYNTSFGSSIVYSKDKMNMLLDNLKIVETMMPYIPDACITVGSFETAVIMNNIMNTTNSMDPNIIITKDIMTMQVASKPNTVIYRPKKYKGDDMSYVVLPTNNGLYHHLATHKKVKDIEIGSEISSGLYSLSLAMIGVKSRDIKSLLSYSNTIKDLMKAISSPTVLNSYNSDITNIIEELSDKDRDILISGNIYNRFKAIDMEYQYGIYLNNPERYYYKGIQNLYDPKGLHDIADEKFKECPIDFERL